MSECVGATLSLDETQIKPGSSDGGSIEQSLAPLKTAVEPAAYQRAPTLMAGASAGSQGQVRVWAPSRKMLWSLAIGSGAAAVLLLLFPLLRPGDVGWFFSICYGLWAIVAFVASVSALRRPGYITTDDAGIGITTLKGSLTLRWTEIKALRGAKDLSEIIIMAPDRIELNAQGKIEISMTGFPFALRRDLLTIILEHTGLKPSRHPPMSPQLFIRPGYSVFNNWCTPVAELKRGSEDDQDVTFTDA